jgi:hypothetical protein
VAGQKYAIRQGWGLCCKKIAWDVRAPRNLHNKEHWRMTMLVITQSLRSQLLFVAQMRTGAAAAAPPAKNDKLSGA